MRKSLKCCDVGVLCEVGNRAVTLSNYLRTFAELPPGKRLHPKQFQISKFSLIVEPPITKKKISEQRKLNLRCTVVVQALNLASFFIFLELNRSLLVFQGKIEFN